MENNPFLLEATNDNIRYLSSQFNSFSVSNYSENSNNDLKVFFGRLIHQLKKFESNLDGKLHAFVENIKEQKPKQEIVKFPILAPKSATLEKSSVFDAFSNNSDKTSEFGGVVPFISESLIPNEKTKPLSQDHTKRFDLRNRRVENIYKPIKILSKDSRYDPFADLPPLSEKEAMRGLSTLITNGIIPKDLDLAPAFEKNPPMTSCLLKLKEKPLHVKKKAQLIQHFKDETLNLHLDAKTFITEKPLNFDDSLKSKGPTAIRSFSQKTKKNVERLVPDWKKLHLSIKKGKFVESDVNFQVFRKYNSANWSRISMILKKIENLLEDNEIRFADIKSKKVIELANFHSKISKNHLISCIVNQEIIKSSMKLPTKRFKGLNAEEMAIRFLQKFYRELKKKREIKINALRNKSAKKIQQCYRIYKLYMATKATIRFNYNEFIEDYSDILKKFKREWPDIKGIERVEIHLNSFSYNEVQRLTMENFLQRANLQIARIFACKETFVEVIYISPIELDDEIINYYSKVIQLGDLINFKEKVHFIYPEGSSYLPYTFSTSKKLLFSPFALRQIKKIIGLKPAYIINGYPSENDLKLARFLKIPCFCGNPTTAASLSKKTGSRDLFLQCNLPIPPSSSKFKNEEEFLNELVILLYENQNINTWIFKINNEFGGRGIASFTVDTSRLVNGLKSLKNCNTIGEEIGEFRSIIKNLAPIKTVMACPFLYRNYREYLDELLKQGGVIEGTPPSVKSEHITPTSIILLIEPSGQFQIKSTYEKLCGPEYRNIGYLMPNRNANNFNLAAICAPIVEILLKKDVFGYITIDLLIFPDPLLKSSFPLFWMIGLDCFLNDFGVILYYFEFLVKGKGDPFSGRYFNELTARNENNSILECNKLNNAKNINHLINLKANTQNEDDSKNKLITEKFMIYCPSIIHPGLMELEYKDFFHKCRMDNILFDLEKKSGASFLLIDAMKNYFLSLVAIGNSWRLAVKNMTDTLNFLIQHVGSTNSQKYEKKAKDIRHDSISLSDIINKIRMLNKNLEKEHEKNTTGRKSVF